MLLRTALLLDVMLDSCWRCAGKAARVLERAVRCGPCPEAEAGVCGTWAGPYTRRCALAAFLSSDV